MIKYLLGLILAVNLFGQFDIRLRKLTLTDKLQIENSGRRTGFTYPASAPASDLIWRLPTADGVGCLQSDGAFQLSIGACSGGSTLPVIDTTKIVKGSVDATKELRFEIDGFTTGTVNVLTPQDASYVIAGTNITNTFTAQQITRDLIPSSAGSWNVGTISDPYSTMVGVQYYARPAGGLCNYVGISGSVISGGLVAVQDTACAIQAQMTNVGFDTVNTVGSYKVQGTTIITATRVLGGLTGLSSSLIPTSNGTLDLASNSFRFREGYINNIYSDALAPYSAGTGVVGTSGVPFGQGNFVSLAASLSFRLGTSTTAGYVMTADASGFGSWQASSGGSALPVVDTTQIITGSVDTSKRMRFEIDGFSPATARTITVQDFDYTLAGTNIQNTFADNTYDWGTSGTRIRTVNAMNEVLYSSASGITTVLSIPNATSSFAIYVPNGGIAASTYTGASAAFSTSLSVTGTSTLQSIVPSANNTYDAGSTSNRWRVYYGRFLNLRTVGAAVAGISAFDASNNLTFAMGDGGGFGGEFTFYTAGLTEYFGAINGQVRFNGNNGLTSNFTCPAGQAVKGMNIQNGGTITATCGVP
jgi:hypothetical protein